MNKLILLLLALVATSSFAAEHIILPGELWNARSNIASVTSGGTTYYPQNGNMRFVVNTSARSATVKAFCEDSTMTEKGIGVRVNGVDLGSYPPLAAGLVTFTVVLPPGDNKTVEFLPSIRNAASLGAVSYGVALYSVDCDAPFIIIPPVRTRPIIFIYGDSVSIGGNAEWPNLQGWVGLLQRRYAGSIILEAHGYRRLYDDGSTAEARRLFAKRIAEVGALKIWLAIGLNDWSPVGFAGAPNFSTAYADFLDKIHAAAPDATIYAQTPTITAAPGSREIDNGYGSSTMDDFRAGVNTACTARPTYCVNVDGKTLVAAGDLADGVHPSAAGNIVYMRAVAAILGL